MKRKILLLVLIVSLSKVFASGIGPFQMNLRGNFGLMNGLLSEKLYYTPENSDRKLLSQLDWDINSIPVFSAAADFYFVKFIYLGLNGNAGISKDSGYMQDYDYLNVLKNGSTDLSRYSKHTNHLDEFYNAEIMIGANLPLFVLNLTPFVSVQYEKIKFTGRNGYYQYADMSLSGLYNTWDSGITPVDLNCGNVISYEQDSVLLKFGLKSEITLIPHVLINLKADISPLSYMASTDSHLLKGTTYKDFISNQFSFDAEAGIYYNFLKFNNIGICFAYQGFTDGYGRTYTKESSSSKWAYNEKYSSGMKKYNWKLSLSYEFKL